MVYSRLISGSWMPKYHGGPRNHVIDTISIHHMAGNMTAKNCASWFSSTNSPKASSNYTIGSDGDIWGSCPEDYESYCTSDRNNDERAVTIEVANDGDENTGWHVSDKAIDSLITLLVDICQRNNIKQLLWKNDPDLAGVVEKQNITLHRWYSATICPGPYLESQIPAIVRRVNAKLNPKPAPSDFTDEEKRILRHVAQSLKKMIEQEETSNDAS